MRLNHLSYTLFCLQVSQWYDLVIFTASMEVSAYKPVIATFKCHGDQM